MAERTTVLTPLAKIIIGGTAGAIVLGGMVFSIIAYLERDQNTQLVIIKAETTDYKKAPADKGGLKLNSIDSPVMSLLDKAEELEEGVEILRPPISEPEPPPIDVSEDPTSATDTAATESQAENKPSAEIEVIETTEDSVKPATPQPITSEDNAQNTTGSSAETIATEVGEGDDANNASSETQSIDAEDEITAAVDSLPQQRPKTPKIVATTDVNSPSYVVQFAAFKNETSAKNTAAVLSTKHKSRLDGMALGYMRWGDYWRVVAEPMPRADANAFCSKFRSVGQDCIIKLMENPNG